MNNIVGYQVTGDPSSGVLIGGTTDPIVIYGYNGTGTDGVVTLQNGSASGDKVYAQTAVLTSGEELTATFGFGIMFPNGCWYTNTSGSGADVVYYKAVI